MEGWVAVDHLVQDAAQRPDITGIRKLEQRTG